jgi:hypothetical protein
MYHVQIKKVSSICTLYIVNGTFTQGLKENHIYNKVKNQLNDQNNGTESFCWNQRRCKR